ncbi:MAG: sigma-70 family RNA polymerase sigma factor [Zetaproteobacteria bacterium]|nr:MAG: sigma-70 family RNA polymerase sigma factor [Zetaproteobacteria bacterium]
MATLPVELSSIALFRRDIRRIERLSREEEIRLARRWRDHRDAEAARRLVTANLYSVDAIAREYRHFGLPEMDLIQEGVLGLMHAVKRFDPERGFRLVTYASWWIRAAIHDYILRSWSIVKLGTNKLQRRIFAGLKKARNAIAAVDGTDCDEVASEFGIDAHRYQETANAYLKRDLSLDGDADGSAMLDALPADDPTPEDYVEEHEWMRYRHASLEQAMQSLSPRDRMIIRQRHLTDTPATLKDLAEEFGISVERVRQLEARAMKKLRAQLSTALCPVET